MAERRCGRLDGGLDIERLDESVIPPPRWVHAGSVDLLARHVSQQSQHERFAVLKAVAGAPTDDNDVRLSERVLYRLVIPRTGVGGIANKPRSLDAGKQIHNDEPLDTIELRGV